MKTKFKGILTLLLALVVQISFAQEKTISGTVTDDSGLPLPGVSVVIEGSNKGVETDFDGKYSISVSEGATLMISYVGMESQSVKTITTSNTINISLKQDANLLDEIIVTALEIKKSKKALGYSVSSIKAAEIEGKPAVDIAQALNGKVAGVHVVMEILVLVLILELEEQILFLEVHSH